ncbi:MAG TPA: hypothetical protein VNW72_09245 [Chthoniobacterales bacterium]|nr:hypothetical protein [Chthoniobacterales bacterium]
MFFNRSPFVVVIVIVIVFVSFLAVNSLRSQEALDAEKSPTPAAESSPEKSAKKPARSLEETMRPEEFKAAGLDKLNEDELQHLDAYLQGYRQSAQKKAAEQAQAKASEEIKKATVKATEEANQSARTKLDSLVSRVDGNIDGVKGHTIIRLEDGSVWKQVNGIDHTDDHFRATVTDHPTAVVFHTTFGYKMRIEGMPEFYVDPIVKP